MGVRAIGPPKEVTDEHPVRFTMHELPYRLITDAPDYRFADIRREDRVLDIGANAGAFCIRAARLSDHVTAVEPVSTRILEENIRLNRARVRVVEGALGDGCPAEVSWDGVKARVRTYTIGELRKLAGGCDFLKCDCEGAEWFIRPEDLSGIRRIEMELHVPPIGGTPDPALLEYIGRHYEFGIDRTPGRDVMGVLGILHASLRGA